jgi:hypothetical protein
VVDDEDDCGAEVDDEEDCEAEVDDEDCGTEDDDEEECGAEDDVVADDAPVFPWVLLTWVVDGC